MKSTAFALITLVVGSIASPTLPVMFDTGITQEVQNERIVTGQIIQAIEDLIQQIKDAGLDPYILDQKFEYSSPIPIVFSANAIVNNLVFTGLSNIVIDSLNFSLLQGRLTFNLVIPALSASVGSINANAIVVGNERSASLTGSVVVSNARLVGDVRVIIGIESGIVFRTIALDFTVADIQSNLELIILGKDLSSKVNTALGTTLPAKLVEFRSEINEVLETFAWRIIRERN